MCAFWNIFQLYLLFFYHINILCILWWFTQCEMLENGWRKWGFFLSAKFNLFTHFKSGKFLSHFSGFLFHKQQQQKQQKKVKAIFRQFTIGKVCQYFWNSTSYQSLMLIEHMRYNQMEMFIHIFMSVFKDIFETIHGR